MTEFEARRQGRRKLLLIGAFFALPFVLGWLAYTFDWTPKASGNHGELLEARPITGNVFEPLKGKWIFVSFDRAACDKACEQKLYYMRQVRIAQGKERERVARLWILEDAQTPKAELLRAIEGTSIVRAEEVGALERFPGADVRTDYIYVIDPLGNLMMRYPRSVDPSGMIKDMRRLLRYSSFG